MVQVYARIRRLDRHRQGHVEAYTPDEDGADSGYYLRATAKYKDRQSPSGADNDKTASMVSANKVLALRTSNKAPEFAVQDPVDDEGTIAKRTVAETAAAGQLVGDPVTAEDEDANDVLTYTLVATTDGSGNFVIDRATGQISVAKGAKFNHVTIPMVDIDPVTIWTNTTLSPSLPQTLRAYQPMWQSQLEPTPTAAYGTVEVMINVTQVDEPPIFTVTVWQLKPPM